MHDATGTMQTSPVIVTGMHRSGTSFVASLLLNAGVHMGDRLMEAGPGNERGHFENLAFVEFQQQLLRSQGHDEAGLLPAGPTPLLHDAFPEDAYAQARMLVAENARATPWGWKDPRCALLLDFWARVMPGAFYVLLYREPAEVIASLFRRGDAAIAEAPEAAARAWLSYNGILLQFARMNRTRCVLANSAVVARNPQSFLSTLATRFSIPLDSTAPSPFDPESMHQMNPDSAEPVLLRYLVPETERLFVDLESEADFAAGVHRDSPVSPRRARTVFFENWASLLNTAQMEPEHERELKDVRALLATADQEMRRAQAAFQQQLQRTTELTEQLAQFKDAAHGGELELVRIQARLEIALHERDHALGRVDERLTSVAMLEARIAEGIERVHRAELEAVRTREAMHLVEYQRDALQERVDGIQEQLEEHAQTRIQLALVTEQLTAAIRERETLLLERGAAADHAQSVQIQSLEAERDGLRNELDEAHRQLRDAETKAETLRAELLKWLDQLETLTLALQTERDEFAEKELRHRDEIQRLEAEIVSLRDRETEVASLIAEAREEAAIARTRYESDLDTMRAQESHLRAAASELQERFDRESAALREREADLERLRASHAVLAKTLEETSSRFLQHVNATLSQTREEAQEIATLIDEIQSSRFWKLKRALGRLLGHGDTRR